MNKAPDGTLGDNLPEPTTAIPRTRRRGGRGPSALVVLPTQTRQTAGSDITTHVTPVPRVQAAIPKKVDAVIDVTPRSVPGKDKSWNIPLIVASTTAVSLAVALAMNTMGSRNVRLDVVHTTEAAKNPPPLPIANTPPIVPTPAIVTPVEPITESPIAIKPLAPEIAALGLGASIENMIQSMDLTNPHSTENLISRLVDIHGASALMNMYATIDKSKLKLVIPTLTVADRGILIAKAQQCLKFATAQPIPGMDTKIAQATSNYWKNKTDDNRYPIGPQAISNGSNGVLKEGDIAAHMFQERHKSELPQIKSMCTEALGMLQGKQ